MLLTPPRHPAEALVPTSQHPWMPDWMQALVGWHPQPPGLVPVPENMQAPEQAWLEQMRREQMMKEMQR
jgi:hypothetical protein